MKVKVDADRCVASGMCAFSAPEVFDQNEHDGVVVLLTELPSAEHHDAVRSAVRNCPNMVIAIEE
ncbi:ferredoxin [Streptomyces sp. LX-29]|uniref:ferredoxin n=1 Tax=unclassified Streptomyces TaxID=2593676 RepID=UPI001185A613|nr:MULTISPECIES: ferredoxin [unclassified Streptomyces]TVL89510.1 ferredoxin [Streptomyces sp. SAJ15]WFB11936.1 ferredoxin [Streptomyces sp. LX-29]